VLLPHRSLRPETLHPRSTIRQAQPELNPGIARLDALFANVFIGVRDFDLIQVRAFAWHLLPS
jgi:hypothetical protein